MTIPPSRLATAVAAAVALGLACVLLSVGGRAPRVAAVALAASDAVPAQSLTLLRTLVTNRAAATRHPPPYRPTAVAGARLDDALTPLLSAAELATLQYYVRGKDTYMEWGSGASTVMVAPLAGRGAWSVENQASWCVTMLERADVAFWGANGLLRYECVDIGETGERNGGGVGWEGGGREGDWQVATWRQLLQPTFINPVFQATLGAPSPAPTPSILLTTSTRWTRLACLCSTPCLWTAASASRARSRPCNTPTQGRSSSFTTTFSGKPCMEPSWSEWSGLRGQDGTRRGGRVGCFGGRGPGGGKRMKSMMRTVLATSFTPYLSAEPIFQPSCPTSKTLSRFYDLVDRADSLVVLAPKALDVNATARATALLDEYVRNPA